MSKQCVDFETIEEMMDEERRGEGQICQAVESFTIAEVIS